MKIIFGISTTRADYGIQKQLFKSLDQNKEYQVLSDCIRNTFIKKIWLYI